MAASAEASIVAGGAGGSDSGMICSGRGGSRRSITGLDWWIGGAGSRCSVFGIQFSVFTCIGAQNVCVALEKAGSPENS